MKTLLTQKTTLVVSLVTVALILTAILLGINFTNIADVKGLTKNKIKIVPEILLAEDILECMESSNVLSVSIFTPEDNKTYMQGNRISANAQMEFKCMDFFKDAELDAQFTWYLDGKEFSNELEASINNPTPGSYNLKLDVILSIEGYGNVQGSDSITFNVVAPKPTEPPITTPKPNTAPQVLIISPTNGSNHGGNQCPVVINFSGEGIDAEDGTLSGASLQWFSTDQAGNRVNFGAGNISMLLFDKYTRIPFTYLIELVVTDSKGLTSTHQITINIDTRACG